MHNGGRDAVVDDITEAVTSLSVQDALLNLDVLSAVASAVAESEPDRMSYSSAAAFDPAQFAMAQHERDCAGARELATMLQVCWAWRKAVCDTDGVWIRLLHAAYPRLDIGRPGQQGRSRKTLFRRMYMALQQVQRLHSKAMVSLPPSRSPGAALDDFLFIVEVRFCHWAGVGADESDLERLRQIGPTETWAGTLSAENLGWRADVEAPCFGLLQLDGAKCTVSVYVNSPSREPGESDTFMLYDAGSMDGSDEAGSEMFEYYTKQELPYAHYDLGANDLDDAGKGLVLDDRVGYQLSMSPHVYTGSIALGLTYDDMLYEEQCVRYLRGEPITTFSSTASLPRDLTAQSGPT